MRPLDGNTIAGAAPFRAAEREYPYEGAKSTWGGMTLRKVVLALGGAGLVGGLAAGCASTGDAGSTGSAEITNPQVHAVGLVTRSAQTPDGYYALGKYYFWQNRFDKARDAFMQAVRLDPDSADALNGLGATYDRSGYYEAAQQAYKAALLKGPEAELVWANMGYSLLLQGKNDEAVPYLREAVRLNPSDTLAQLHLAQAGGGNGGADTRIAQENPQAMAQNKNSLSKAPPDGPSRHKETVATAVMPEIHTLEQDAVVRAGAASEPVAITAAPYQGDIVESAPVAEASGGAGGMPAVGARQKQARASMPPALALRHARLEVSNGNGVNGMARAIGAELRKHGANVARVTNKRPFDTQRTVIVCNSGAWSEQAKSLARVLPNSPMVMVGTLAQRRVDIRVILGADAALAWKGNGVKSVHVAAIF